jgi:hypothetical protein
MLDMIEHLEQQELDETLKNLTEKNNKATFYISTPLSDFDGQSPTNPFHKNCFTKPRFTELLNKYFKQTTIYHVDWDYSAKMGETQPHGKVIAICIQ